MRNGLLGVLGICVLGASPLLARAQPLPTLPSATIDFKDPAKAVANPPAVDWQPHSESADCLRYWARGEFLLWRVRDTPLPVPLVTTGDPNVGFAAGTNNAGALDQSSTQALLGGHGADLGTFSGMRLVLGGWIDCQRTIGIEGSGFFLARQTSHFSAASDADGNPPIYLPGFNVIDGAERAFAIADPLRGFSGSVVASSSLQLWGAELNGLVNLWRRPGLEVSLLGGLRYADLQESLQIHYTNNDLILLNTQLFNDRFDTSNRFYGGQLGARVAWQHDRLAIDLTGKVALGATHQVVNIQGDSSQTALPGGLAPTPGAFLGGIYAQPSNIGQRSATEFTVLPAVELKVAYAITPRLRTFIGYDFMYWNQVVRPGSQIDHNINPSQNVLFGGNGALAGPAAPAPLFQRSDFWAQGVSFGLEFRY